MSIIFNDVYNNRPNYCHALEVETGSELEELIYALYDDLANTYNHASLY